MKNAEQIEEEHIKKLAFGLNRLGINVDLSNEIHYVACRDILEAAVSYAHQAQLDKNVKEYIGLSDTVERSVE